MKKILILDDTPARAEALSKVLKEDLAIVTNVTTVRGFQEMVKGFPPDLIILDHDLGEGLSGMEALEFVPDVPVLVWSSNGPASKEMKLRLDDKIKEGARTAPATIISIAQFFEVLDFVITTLDGMPSAD